MKGKRVRFVTGQRSATGGGFGKPSSTRRRKSSRRESLKVEREELRQEARRSRTAFRSFLASVDSTRAETEALRLIAEFEQSDLLLDKLRKAMLSSTMTRYQVAKVSGIAESQLSRFVKGQRGLSAESIDRLASALGLVVTFVPKGKTRKGR